jgi:radical SAM protein with 4Fe4S-binding SPASM domain
MVSSGIIINQYPNQSYKTIFNQNSGLLIRLEDQVGIEPFWCSFGPELIDVSITNWCDKGCSHCYKESNVNGSYLSIDDYIVILRQAAQMKVLQIAMGGGNPNQHPDFCEMLRQTREGYNIVPSYTTNGRGLEEDVLVATKKYCGAVAVSAYEPYADTWKAARKLLDHGVRTNIHFLLTSKSVDTAIRWLENPSRILKDINAIIFLNYKPVGRNPKQELLLKKSQKYVTFFQLAGRTYPFKIGFDSCSISGITRFMKVPRTFIERCEAGRFSMYISESNRMYPCSFMVNKIEGVPVTKDNIQTVWRNHDFFTGIRERLREHSCPDCVVQNDCFGGCPIFPEINLCSDKDYKAF